MSDWNQKVIAEFRANGGKVGGPYTGRTLLLLNTTGAKSGLPRVHPLVCTELEKGLVIIASKGGAPTHPAWYFNILANPQVAVEYGTEKFSAFARVTEEPERTELYNIMAEIYPFFADYRQKTTRIIPVIVLNRS